MGTGLFAAGLGRAGTDPVYVPAIATPPTLPAAVKWDPNARQWVQNADGTMAAVHPVDQIVALRLTLEEGSVPSARSVGNNVRRRIARVAPARVPSIIADEVRLVLSDLIANGDVRVVSITVDQTMPGRVTFAVTYLNLRLVPPVGSEPPQPTTVSTTL
jgi:hypothetical protein